MDLTDAEGKARELFHCGQCQGPVQRVRFETEPVLLRQRIVIECHGKHAFICERDAEFSHAFRRGVFPPKRITVFKHPAADHGASLLSGAPNLGAAGGRSGDGPRASLTLMAGGV